MLTLTYQQIADELGISTIAARSRARRAAARGRWRVIRANHPTGPSYIEIPEEDLLLRAIASSGRIKKPSRTSKSARIHSYVEQKDVRKTLLLALDHLEFLTSRLAEEEQVHEEARRTAELLEMRLAKAQEDLALKNIWIEELDALLISVYKQKSDLSKLLKFINR